MTPSLRIGDTVPPSPRLSLLNWENYPSLGLRGDQPQASLRGRPSTSHHLGFTNFFLPLAVRTLLLFLFGIAYGIIITHLHDDSQLVPVKVEGIHRSDWRYLLFWGVAGIGLGSLLPWIDLLSENTSRAKPLPSTSQSHTVSEKDLLSNDNRPSSSASSKPSVVNKPTTSADWTPVVRSIGAFVGIAFAIVGLLQYLSLAVCTD